MGGLEFWSRVVDRAAVLASASSKTFALRTGNQPCFFVRNTHGSIVLLKEGCQTSYQHRSCCRLRASDDCKFGLSLAGYCWSWPPVCFQKSSQSQSAHAADSS